MSGLAYGKTTDDKTRPIQVDANGIVRTNALTVGTVGAPSVDVVTVQGVGFVSEKTITRTADTNAYVAGKAIGIDAAGSPGSAIHTFANVGPSGGIVTISGHDLMVYLAAVPATMTSFRLHLYDASPTAILDNAAWDLPSGDRTKYLGYLDLGTPVDVGSTLFVQTDGLAKQFKLAAASTSLFGILVTNGAYTPTSGEVYKVRLKGAAV